MILLLISMYFASKTLIGFLIPILIFFISGLMIFFIERNKYNEVYGYDGNTYPLIHLTTSFGAIGLFIFFTLNFIIRTDEIKSQEYIIIDRYPSYGGKGKRNILHPDFIIEYKNEDKIISFSEEFYNDMDLFKTIELKTSKGLFGFDILLKKELKK